MKILVTGGAGYLGTALCDLLAARPDVDELIIYDNLSRPNRNLFIEGQLPAHPGLRARFVLADLLDTRRLEQELDGTDVVVHLAARVTTPFAHDDLHGFDQVNRWGTAELGYLLERPGCTVSRVVNVSSAAVYGDTAEAATPETVPAPVSAYGRSKWEGERMLARLSQDLELCSVRCANVYGYGKSMRFDAVVNRLLFEAHFGGRMTVTGSGERRRSFVHIDAAARVLEHTAMGELGAGIFNLVDRTDSVLDVARAIGTLIPEVETMFISQHLRLPDSVIAPDPRVPDALLEHRELAAVLQEARRKFAF